MEDHNSGRCLRERYLEPSEPLVKMWSQLSWARAKEAQPMGEHFRQRGWPVQRACGRGNWVNLGAERWAVGLGSGEEGGVVSWAGARRRQHLADMFRSLVLIWRAMGGRFVKDCLRAHVGRIQAGKPVEAWGCSGSLNAVLVEETDVNLGSGEKPAVRDGGWVRVHRGAGWARRCRPGWAGVDERAAAQPSDGRTPFRLRDSYWRSPHITRAFPVPDALGYLSNWWSKTFPWRTLISSLVYERITYIFRSQSNRCAYLSPTYLLWTCTNWVIVCANGWWGACVWVCNY